MDAGPGLSKLVKTVAPRVKVSPPDDAAILESVMDFPPEGTERGIIVPYTINVSRGPVTVRRLWGPSDPYNAWDTYMTKKRQNITEFLGQRLGFWNFGSLERHVTAYWASHVAVWGRHEPRNLHTLVEIGKELGISDSWKRSLPDPWIHSIAKTGPKTYTVFLHPKVVVTTRSERRGGRVLHNESGPAVVWWDGTEEWRWQGTQVPMDVVLNPESLAPEDIIREKNTQVREVMLRRYGPKNLFDKLAAEVVGEDKDKYGNPRQLLRIDLGHTEQFNRPQATIIQAVKVRCPSTKLEYLLMVPPNVRTPLEAVAWTFNMRPEQYAPLEES